MKRFISVLMLICIFASMLTVNAFAVTDITVKGDVKENTYYFNVTSDREAIGFNIVFPAPETFNAGAIEIKLYSGETPLSTTSNSSELTANTSLTANIVFYGKPSGSWNTTWTNYITETLLPTKAVITANGLTKEFAVGNQSGTVPTLSSSKPVTVMNGSSLVGYYNTLNEALAAAPTGAVVELKEGEYQMVSTSNKNLTIKGASGTNKANVKVKANTVTAHHGCSINFADLTIVAPNADYTGMQHLSSASFNNCNITNEFWSYAPTASFTNCTFNQSSSGKYNIWTYGSTNISFSGCTFNSAGKSMLVYNEGNAARTVSVSGCVFNASAPVSGKAAIELDSAYHPVTLNIDSATTQSGFATDTVCGNPLWNEKVNGVIGKQGGQAVVNKDGKQIYPELPEPTPTPIPNPYGVPATADNSQMGLWCVLFAALAVTAILTRKKRSA